jgi:AcrR family transcriptional regulator
VTTRRGSSVSPAEPDPEIDSEIDPPQSPDGWARRRQRVALDIELAALELFAEHGLDAVSIEQITAVAGISMRTFFRYFPTRDDLMFALPQRQVDHLCAAALARPPAESVLEAFIAAVRVQGEQPEEDRLRLWGRALQKGVLPAHDQMRPTTGMVAAYAEVIAQREHIKPTDMRAEVMATAIAGVMWSSFLRWLESNGKSTLADIIEKSFTILADLNFHAGTAGSSAVAKRSGRAGRSR